MVGMRNMSEPQSILVVDDDEADREFILHLMKRRRVVNPVHLVHHGSEATDFLFCGGKYWQRHLEPVPGLILLDLEMPKLHGCELLKVIRQASRTQAVAVVVITGMVVTQEMLTMMRHDGASAIVEKPLRFEQLEVAVRNTGFRFVMGDGRNSKVPADPSSDRA